MKTCLALVQGDAVNVAAQILQSRLDPGSPWCVYWLATALYDASAGCNKDVICAFFFAHLEGEKQLSVCGAENS